VGWLGDLLGFVGVGVVVVCCDFLGHGGVVWLGCVFGCGFLADWVGGV